MRTMKHIARDLETIHSTFNVPKKKYSFETLTTMVCCSPNNVKLISVKLKRVTKVQLKFITASWEGVSTDDDILDTVLLQLITWEVPRDLNNIHRHRSLLSGKTLYPLSFVLGKKKLLISIKQDH